MFKYFSSCKKTFFKKIYTFLPNFVESKPAGLPSLLIMAAIEKLVILPLELVSQELLFEFSIMLFKVTEAFDEKLTSGIFVINIFSNGGAFWSSEVFWVKNDVHFQSVNFLTSCLKTIFLSLTFSVKL